MSLIKNFKTNSSKFDIRLIICNLVVSAGFNIGDLNSLIDATVMSCCMDGRERINKDDFINGLETLKKSRSKSLGIAEVPSVKWEDVGGLHEVKRELLQVLGKPHRI